MLVERMFVPAFANSELEALHDGAVIDFGFRISDFGLTEPNRQSEIGNPKLAFTTDSYVVHPWRFPGGDIGSLAVHGTVNDLAMCGARAAFSSALILEEGLPMQDLWRIVQSMQHGRGRSGRADCHRRYQGR